MKIEFDKRVFWRVLIVAFLLNIIWCIIASYILSRLGYMGAFVFFAIIPGIVYGVSGAIKFKKGEEDEKK